MAIQFKMVAKTNSLATPPETNFYPCAVHQGEETLETLANRISMSTSLTEADCFGVMYALTNAIGDALANGKIVRIDSLGTFQLTIQGLPAPEAEVRGKSYIKGNRVVFKPTKRLKSYLKRVNYIRIK
ncbi:MAG: HU family DNA-binding protein [Flavobacterium sp.]|jgi:predicted histone-like DNA-binding protein|nr:HU family DNA-binding protein [Flavobacterium sp.]HQV36343.1 HU family DNA-binding protein [Flavobacterium sp.]HQX05091.1 HU family DNA-binding protein [Flavobacterium sp.]